jgi:biopolymer transport protein TolR
MGVSLTPQGGTGRQRSKPMSEINVTPFVDVMLVLLIIFMVTAPLLAVGVPINAPDTDAPPLTSSEEPLTISVDQDGVIYLQETVVDLESLVPRLLAIGDNGYDEAIYIRADETVDYGDVMVVMGHINAAGFTRIALVTDPKHD